MEVLDGDDIRLSSRGRYAERDIVQVVDSFPINNNKQTEKVAISAW